MMYNSSSTRSVLATILNTVLFLTACLLLGACAHTPAARDDSLVQEDTKPIYLYEVEFYLDGRRLEATRPVRYGQEVPQVGLSTRLDRPEFGSTVALSPFPQGQSAHEVLLTPERPQGKNTLTIRIRITDRKSAIKKWHAKWDAFAPFREVIFGNPYLHAVPNFPVEVGVLVGYHDAAPYLQARSYYHLQHERQQAGFDLEAVPAETRALFLKPPPEQMVRRDLELNKWVTIKYHYLGGEGPARIELYTHNMEVGVGGY